ncbi:hypothetical protein GWK47_026056 [Chionoecetes opilio]|uniref:Uncharacterized protein n=1 Tax=Chionoecetes opilio TaxID=41210 RepID=A0A8J8WF89_CHIOP|nr:hypothetical protein GWK47_026056 [Chionoecetes opilio]
MEFPKRSSVRFVVLYFGYNSALSTTPHGDGSDSQAVRTIHAAPKERVAAGGHQPGIHCTLEDVECGGLVYVSLSHYTVPQPAVSRQEGAEESLCPGEGHNELLVPLVGVPGGVWVRCRPRLPECSEVRGALLEDFVSDAQAGHVSPVL